jgi:tetratricopeptide (TPR) repeat protein
MNRLLLVCICSVAGLTLASAAQARDDIAYFDRATRKEVPATGSILEETPARVVFKPGTGVATKEIAATDIIDIAYEVPAAVKLAYGRARAEERKATESSLKDAERDKALAEALKSYQEILPKLAGDKYRNVVRNTRFKIARLQARLAEDNPSKVDAAIEALTQFQKEYPEGWEIHPAGRLLARLEWEKGNAEAAGKTYEALAAIPGLPQEARQEYELLGAEVLIQAKKCVDAEKKLQSLLKALPKDDPQAARVRIYLVECLGIAGKLAEAVSQLEEIIAKTSDRDLKAVAYNSLGDCYRLNGRPKEALWPYLWVDVIYHQDKQEHAKAIAQLAKLFDEQGDKARAKLYKDKLKRENR